MFLAAGWFDENTDESSEGRCYTVAGFVGNQESAAILDMRWGDALKKYDLKYFKASELEMGFGEFAKHRVDPTKLHKPLSAREKQLIVEIKTAFIDLIVKTDELYGIGTVLMLRDLELLKAEHPELAAKLRE